jgi:hypothetical protein
MGMAQFHMEYTLTIASLPAGFMFFSISFHPVLNSITPENVKYRLSKTRFK